MSARVLVDTSFLVARLDERDIHHRTAEALHARFRAQDAMYLYLDCVANETVTVLARRAVARKLDPRPVIDRVRRQIPAEVLVWTGPEWPRLWDEVLDTLVEHGGRLSFHDCVLVLVCRQGGIEWVASFDRGFDDIQGVRRVGDPAAVPPG